MVASRGGQGSRLGLVTTGGTVGSHLIRDRVVLGPIEHAPERVLLEEVAEEVGCALVATTPFRVSSEDMTPTHWVGLASACRDVASAGVDAVLVLHGTDTACFTAAALSFLLRDLAVPVAVTGANLPPAHPRSDARTNVRGAVVALAHRASGVVLAFAGEADATTVVHSATHVRKTGVAGRATFTSVNAPPIAEVRADGVYVPRGDHAGAPRAARPVPRFDERVLMLRCHPGADFSLLADRVCDGDVRGIVLELYQSATGPTATRDRYSIVGFVERCALAGVTIVGVTESGLDTQRVYPSTERLRQAGMIVLLGMLPEVATVKLMLGLGQPDHARGIAEWLRRPLVDELSTTADGGEETRVLEEEIR